MDSVKSAMEPERDRVIGADTPFCILVSISFILFLRDNRDENDKKRKDGTFEE